MFIRISKYLSSRESAGEQWHGEKAGNQNEDKNETNLENETAITETLPWNFMSLQNPCVETQSPVWEYVAMETWSTVWVSRTVWVSGTETAHGAPCPYERNLRERTIASSTATGRSHSSVNQQVGHHRTWVSLPASRIEGTVSLLFIHHQFMGLCNNATLSLYFSHYFAHFN